MKLTVKIVAGVVLLGVVFLAYAALAALDNVTYLKNFNQTAPAREAATAKAKEKKTEPTPTESAEPKTTP